MKNSVPAIILILTCSLAEYGETQSKRCGLGKFRCKNSECIASELLCDGQVDCADGSDETADECDKPEITCGDYLFRCSYGACVSGNAPCNGIKDCADNSDETLPRCRRDNQQIAARTCAANEFRCDNGECISQNELCDGQADCADGSDETYLQCGSLPCTGYTFRCDYGACINGNYKCDGVSHCVNGSDEDPRECKYTTVRPPYPRPTPIPPTTRRPPPLSPSTVKPLIGCLVPEQPANGYWKLAPRQCPRQGNCNVAQGVQLEPGANLIYGCDRGFKLNGYGSVFCARDGQWSNIPECVEIRCESLYLPSLSAQCTNINGFPEPCVNATPGTLASIECRYGYRPQSTSLIKNVQYRCNGTGHWQPEPLRCVAGPLTINIYVNDSSVTVHQDPNKNDSTLIEVFDDKIVIYRNRDRAKNQHISDLPVWRRK